MNEVTSLIFNSSPNGLLIKKIGDVVDYQQPTQYIVNSTNYDDAYNVPVLTAGQTFILGYTNEKSGIYPASKATPVIIFDDFTGAFKWVDFPFKVKSSAMKFLKVKNDDVLLRYIFHVMGYLNFSSTEHKRLWIGTYSEFEIPIPPLAVQEEIVRILDKFTELEAELEKEQEARKKQYEWYRDQLLDNCANAVDMEFGDLFDLKNGFAFKSNLFRNAGSPILRITNIQANSITVDSLVCIDTADYKENLFEYAVNPGDIVIAMSGATTGKIGVNKTNQTFFLNQRVGKFIPKENVVLNRFLYHLLLRKYQEIYAISCGGAQPNLSSEKLKRIRARIPPLEEQQYIVTILDHLDALCNDITTGLPAEIAARRKQYEYYRDKLLSFEEVA